MRSYIHSQEDAVDKQFGRWLRDHRVNVLKLGLIEASELLGIESERLQRIESGQKAVTKRECLAFSGAYGIKFDLLLKRALSNW